MANQDKETWGFMIIIGIITNVLSVVGIVICNKYIIEVDGFNFSVFLSFLHFATTAIGTRVLLQFGYFTHNNPQLNGVLVVAVGSLLSVAFMNLNLAYNSVGFYQLSKLACIPFILLIEYLVYNKSVSGSIQCTLIPITLGVGYATVYDVNLHLFGIVIAFCAIIFTALAQIFTNTYQKTLDCNALQLLYHTAPYIALGMLLMSPMFDDVNSLLKFQMTSGCFMRIALSCAFALGVNISNYYVLGKTSPLTYQVLGHMKTIMILVLGFTVFNKQIDIRNVVGIIVALAGVIAYTEVRRKQALVSNLPIVTTSAPGLSTK